MKKENCPEGDSAKLRHRLVSKMYMSIWLPEHFCVKRLAGSHAIGSLEMAIEATEIPQGYQLRCSPKPEWRRGMGEILYVCFDKFLGFQDPGSRRWMVSIYSSESQLRYSVRAV